MSQEEEMEFNSHKWVWVKDPALTFVKGFILEDNLDEGTKIKVRTSNDKDVILMKDEVEQVNPPKFNNCDDMAELTHLNEPSVLYNLEQRYMNDFIYTYSGLFLVAVNPYMSLPIYGPDYVDMYNGTNSDQQKPHIFALTETTYRYMLEKQQNQSMLVTGESGAGKTENTKKIIQYLAAITRHTSASDTSFSQNGEEPTTFEEQILQANPILEAFGNAQTVRNNNSSRFGKFIRIEFSPKGKIAGANIEWYLLEKSRVVSQASNERNYHVFYQLLVGLSDSEKKSLHINSAAKTFNYLKKGNITIPNVDDKKEYRDLIHAFETMNFSKDQYYEIFRTLAIILLIGNLDFASKDNDKARFDTKAPTKELCELLGVKEADFKAAITSPKVKAGKEYVTQFRTAAQAKFSLDAIAKSLYEKTFKYIVDKINDKLDHSLSSSNFIGVLDIAGFEIFKQNSFEQLCINYTNEKLQQFFNHHMFVLEQNEYIKENISWKFVDFGQDLQGTIELIESNSNPIGIFAILNEECIVPKASDKSFISKLNSIWDKKSDKFKKSRYDNGFTVKHYAADVEYTTDEWLDKNRDPLNQTAVDLLLKAENRHIAELLDSEESKSSANGNGGGKGGMFRTVAMRHKEQLNDLMTQLGSTYPHFVRCILPNNKKKPHLLDKKIVLDQLRCNGVLEGIRIARAGYPNRIFYKEFYQRYKYLSKELQAFGGSTDFKKSCEIILKSVSLSPEVYKLGLTKIFFKNGILAQLEVKREAVIKDIMVLVQAAVRGYLVRFKIKRELKKVQAAQVIKKNFLLFNELKQNEWYNLMIKLKPFLDSSKQQQQRQLVLDEVNKFKQKISELTVEKTTVLKEKEDLEKDLVKLNTVLATERELLSEKEKELQNTKKSEIQLQQDLQSNEAKVETLQKQVTALTTEKETFDKKLGQLKEEMELKLKRIEDLETQKKLIGEEKGKLQRELSKMTSTQKDNDAQTELKIKSAQTTLNLELKKVNKENKDLKDQLVKLKESSTKLELSRSSKTRDMDTLNRTIEIQKLQIAELEKTKDDLSKEHQEMKQKLADNEIKMEETMSKFKKLESDALEAKNLLKLKIADDIKFERGRQKFDTEIMELKHEKRQLEKEKQELRDKAAEMEQQLQQFMDSQASKSLSSESKSKDIGRQSNEEYAAMKLQLNEKSAMLTHETQERKRLEQEVKMLQTRLASESFDNQKLNAQLRKLKRGSRINVQETSFSNDFLNSSLDEEDEVKVEKLTKEVDELKQQLELERKTNKRVEELALGLEKQLKSSKGNDLIRKFNNMSNERSGADDIYKIKFENAEAKLKVLEKQLREYRMSPLKENFNISNTGNAMPTPHEADLMKKLKAAKAEISRLKKKLQDSMVSEGRSYDDSGNDSKEFIMQEELVTSRLRLESSESKIQELTRQAKMYKERSDEYFDKLEAAEHAVRSSKRNETFARQELKEVTASMQELKDSVRQNDSQLAKMKLKINQMEAKVQSKDTEISRLRNTQQTLTKELEHYRFKLVMDSKEKRGESAQKQKLILETELKKELQMSKMLLENCETEKQEIESELARLKEEQRELMRKSKTVESENSKMRSREKQDRKKMESLVSQINTLHEAMDKMIKERELIQKDKRVLEEKVEEFLNNDDSDAAISVVLEQQKQEIERNRKELKHHMNIEKELKSQLFEEKEKILMVVEENKGLENLIRQLKNETKNNGDNKDDEFYITKIRELEKSLKRLEQNENNINVMERLVKDLKSKMELVEREKTQLSKENEDMNNKMSQLRSLVEELQESESQAKLKAKKAERELKEQKEEKIRSEMDLINWKNKFNKFSRKQ